MYNPVNSLLNQKLSLDEITTTFNVAIDGINSIADILYCADLSGIDKHSLNGLGSALLILNGVVEISAGKIKESTHE